MRKRFTKNPYPPSAPTKHNLPPTQGIWRALVEDGKLTKNLGVENWPSVVKVKRSSTLGAPTQPTEAPIDMQILQQTRQLYLITKTIKILFSKTTTREDIFGRPQSETC